MHRAPTLRLRRLAAAFADWGISTAQSLEEVRAVRDLHDKRSLHIFASGGIRSGMDVAKCVALGADLVGLAGPFLKRAVESPEAVADEMELLKAELRIAMFCSGVGQLSGLRKAGVLSKKNETA